MNEELTRIDSIMVRYLTGNADQAEKEYLISWLKESEANKEYFFSLKASWETAGKVPTITGLGSPVRKTGWIKWLKYAAAIVVFAGIGSGLYLVLHKTGNRQRPVVFTEITTGNGQKKEVTLTDGTKVWLNSGTFFKYGDNYGEKKREVYLKGEAFFEVKRDTTRTFVVLTDNVTIKVLGTSFNVNCYPDLSQVETTVISGVVSVENAGTEEEKSVVILNKQEKGTFLKDQHRMLVQKDPGNSLTSNIAALGFRKITLNSEETVNTAAWKDRTLVIDNETLEEMAVKLHRWFNVDIKIQEGNYKNYRYKGKFDDVKSVFQVLEVIRLTTPFTYEYNEKTKEITIHETN